MGHLPICPAKQGAALNRTTGKRHPLRYLLTGIVVVLGLVALLGSGGGGGSGDGTSTDSTNEGWLNITYPTTAATYAAATSPQYLYGDVFISPTWWRCCSGSASDTGVTVVWRNEATGQSDQASQHVGICWFLWQPYLCDHTWSANIPVVEGSNRIVVMASDPAGNTGKGTLTITRAPDLTAPVVISTTPAANDTDVDPSFSVYVQFSESIDPASLDNTSFMLRTFAGNPIDGAITLFASGDQATFQPAGIVPPDATYTVTLTTQITDLAGNPMAADHVWSFATGAGDTTAPTVATTFPLPGATDVALDETIRATFSEVMDNATVTASTFRLLDGGGNPVAGSVSAAGDNATFTPSNPLEQNSLYSAAITTGVTDLAGNAMQSSYTWSFSTTVPDTTPPTVIATSPENNATGVAIDGSLSVAFSEPMAQASINAATFLLHDSGDNPVSGSVDGGSIFRPYTRLSLAENYTATITTGATDLAGNPLEDPYSWSFTTTPDGGGSWMPVTTANAPSPRQDATAVWTGQEMIVWGGYNGSYLNSGGRYNPGTDSWQPVSTINAPGGCSTPVSAWTGQEMIVWCGRIVTGGAGGRYNPATDSWTPMSTFSAPHFNHSTAVWTGQEMIVWGGYGSTYSNLGGRYNPSTDTWQQTTLTNAPAPRVYHTAVWTGSEMIVWGGDGGPFVYLGDTGGRYNPVTDSWRSVSNNAAPYNKAGHVAGWADSRMIVWAGNENSGSYNPATDSWSAIAALDALLYRDSPFSASTGNEFFVWGGRSLASGGYYDPDADSWSLVTYSGAPSGRGEGVSLWTGSEFIIWGGVDWTGSYTNSGGRYTP